MTFGALAFPAPREFHLGTEAICRDGEVSQQREGAPQRRSTDASRLTFPLQLVLIICGGITATTGAYWLANFQVRTEMSGIRSDMRDIKTTMDGLRSFQASQIDTLRLENDDLKHKEALDAVRIEETRVIVAEIKGFMTAAGMKGIVK